MSSQSSQGSIPKQQAKDKRSSPSRPAAPKTILVPPQHPYALTDPCQGEQELSDENIPPNPLALMTPPMSPTHTATTTTFDEHYHASLQTRVSMLPLSGPSSVPPTAASSSSAARASSGSSSLSSSSATHHAKVDRHHYQHHHHHHHHHHARHKPSPPHRRRSLQLGSYPENAWSDVSSTVSAPASSTPSIVTRPSPSFKFSRPLSMRWEDYEDWEREDVEAALYQAADDNPEHTIQSLDIRPYSSHNRFGYPNRRQLLFDLDFSEMAAYQRQFEGIHDANGDSDQSGILDSYRESVSEQVAKARRVMEKNKQILASFEEELDNVQKSIDKNMEECNSARTAVEENFWKLECLALNLEMDRQEISKQIQTVNREGSQAVESVSSWQVRIDWLGQQIDNTSSYVSELVLSEQECMSFVRMLVHENQQHAGAPLISRAARQRIESVAPPQPSSKLAIPHSPTPTTTTLVASEPETTLVSQSECGSRSKGKQRADSPTSVSSTASPPQQQGPLPLPLHGRHSAADLLRDFSRLTIALEQRQPRATYSLFRRARSNSTGGSGGVGAYHPAQLRRPFVTFQRGHQAYAQAQAQQMRSQGQQSSSSKSSSSSSNSNNNNNNNSPDSRSLSAQDRAGAAPGTLPQLENLTGLPKIVPLATFDVPTVAAPAPAASNGRIKRVSLASLPPVPMHSWIRFQFNKVVGSRSSKPVVLYMASKS